MPETINQPNIVDRFYAEYLIELRKHLREVNSEMETFGEIYLRHLNKKDLIFKVSDLIINTLLTDREMTENDIRNISERHKANQELVKWH